MVLSKLVIALVAPLGTGLVAQGLGLGALAMGRRRLGMAFVALGMAWLWVWSTPAASVWLRQQVEAPFAPMPLAAVPTADVVVVLGGALYPAHSANPHWDAHGAADRVLHAARLYHAGKAPRILVSGGASPGVYAYPEADAMAALLHALGVPHDAILLESLSLNTEANARQSASILQREGWDQVLLVTSALHMARALAEFNAAGIPALPAATDYDGPGPSGLRRYLPHADALDISGRAFKEIIGLWAVHLRRS